MAAGTGGRELAHLGAQNMDHRWIVASLIEMHDYAERFDLEGVASDLAAAIEKVSPALGGALANGKRAGKTGGLPGFVTQGSNVVPLPMRRAEAAKVNA